MSFLTNNLPESLVEHEFDWSLKMLTLMQQMAAQKTNAVLQLLVDVERLESERRYPENGLLFADKHWRAFYHCHEATSMHPDEHGHFHLFTDLGNQNWAHVVGLSIDAEGQALQWFMVNRWVTDGDWLESGDFFKQLACATENDESDGLVEKWLVSLLQLYRETLFDLLEKRDAALDRRSENRGREEIFEDRDIYTLATQPIDLQATLEEHLIHKYTKDQQTLNDEPIEQRAPGA